VQLANGSREEGTTTAARSMAMLEEGHWGPKRIWYLSSRSGIGNQIDTWCCGEDRSLRIGQVLHRIANMCSLPQAACALRDPLTDGG
jgi:hypothetical protein